MNVKIDTKEKFTVITPNEADITANMTDELCDLMLNNLKKDVPHIIFNMKNIQSCKVGFITTIASIQKQFYAKESSFVVCGINKEIENIVKELPEEMNTTPTESEAWDILQMEEIERELLNNIGEENN